MSRKKLRVTNHARVRVKERLNISSKKNISKVLNDALLFGHPAADYFGDFADYLKYNKSKYSDHTGLKVYLNYMVFYHNKTIITTYKVPKKFLPCEKYLRRNSLYNRCPYLKRLYDLVGYDFFHDVISVLGSSVTKIRSVTRPMTRYITPMIRTKPCTTG